MSIKTDIICSLPDWAKEIPYQIKTIAVQDACNAVKAAKLKFKRTGKFQEVKFRSKRRGNNNIFIPKQSVCEDGFYPRLLGKLNIREKVGDVNYDCRVVLQNSPYFLLIPKAVQIKIPDKQRYSVVALDPGVRTFQTLYAPDFVAKVGSQDFSRIYRLCCALDKNQSLQMNFYRRSRKKTSERIRWKIKDLISELHNKLANFLVKSCVTILIPHFEISEMISKLNSKVARSMLSWAHFRFKNILKNKAKEYSCEVIEVSEAYTSKTCSKCGKIQNIGSKKVMKCSCGITLDRDYNGARGVFLRNFSSVERYFPTVI